MGLTRQSEPVDAVPAGTPDAARRPPDGDAIGGAVQPPAPPATLRDAGLTVGQLADLVLKLLYLHGGLTGFEIARELRLPFGLVDERLGFLKEQRAAK